MLDTALVNPYLVNNSFFLRDAMAKYELHSSLQHTQQSVACDLIELKYIT